MSRLLATAGTKFYIGPAKFYPDGGDFTAADFPETGLGAITWTRILGTTNLGSAGDVAELITSVQVDTGDPDKSRVRKAKGAFNGGTMELVCDLDGDDPGQLALIEASRDNVSYAFKIEFADAPAGGTPSIRYFVALVMSTAEQFDEANSIIKLNSTLEIDSNIVRVAAAEAEA